MNGVFTISLDFELHWGGFEKWPLSVTPESSVPVNLKGNSYNGYFLRTREVIPQILELFKRHGLHASWATVGMLLHDSKNSLLENAPTLKPTYQTKGLSAYQYINEVGIGANEGSDPFHFAPSLIRQILETPNQELGTHSFSHFYCNEPGQTLEQFREDLRAARRVAIDYNTKFESMVFPRNQFNNEYLKVCYEEGIRSVRSNPIDWFWEIKSTQYESLWKRLNRGLDAYFPIGKRNTYKICQIPFHEGLPICLPASRLLRPYRPGELILNDLKIKRIKTEMEWAARQGEVYHLWWHPHNFGWYPTQSMDGLIKILQHYSYCQDKYNMRSLTMCETAELIVKKNGEAQAA